MAIHAGRYDDALDCLEEAKANFVHVGAKEDVLAIGRPHRGVPGPHGGNRAALELACERSCPGGPAKGVAKVVPLLERVRGYALYQQGNRDGAREALEASLAAARTRRDLFEVTLTLLALTELDRLEGVEPRAEIVAESRTLLSSLKVRTVPATPLVAR